MGDGMGRIVTSTTAMQATHLIMDREHDGEPSILIGLVADQASSFILSVICGVRRVMSAPRGEQLETGHDVHRW